MSTYCKWLLCHAPRVVACSQESLMYSLILIRHKEYCHRWSVFSSFWKTRTTSFWDHQIHLPRNEHDPFSWGGTYRTSGTWKCICSKWESKAPLSADSGGILWGFKDIRLEMSILSHTEWWHHNKVISARNINFYFL